MKIAYRPASADAGNGFAKRRFLAVSAIAVAALAAGNPAQARTPIAAGAAKHFKAGWAYLRP